MPYVGNPLANAFSSRVKQDLTGQSGTSFTLTHAVSSANDLSVYINHVRQEPTTAYTVDYNTLTTTGSVAGTDDFYIIYDELGLQSIAHDSAQAMKATSGTFTGAITTTQMASSGPVSGTTGTFSGAISGTLGTAAQTNITSVGTLTSATISGDLTVDTNTLKVDSSNNRIGIGTASPAAPLHMDTGATTDIMRFGSGGRWGFQVQNSDPRYVALSRSMNGTSSPVLSIDHDTGHVGINTNTPDSSYNFLVKETGAGSGIKVQAVGAGCEAYLQLQGETSGGSTRTIMFKQDNGDSARLACAQAVEWTIESGDVAAYRMKSDRQQIMSISGDQNPGNNMATLSLGYHLGGNKGGLYMPTYSYYGDIYFEVRNNDTHNGRTHDDIKFNRNGYRHGGIKIIGNSGVSYDSISDYREKTDEKPIDDAIGTVKKLKPYNFKWKKSGKRQDGFFAHEVDELLDYVVTGEKDATKTYEGVVLNKEGNMIASNIKKEDFDKRLDDADDEEASPPGETTYPEGSTWKATHEDIEPQGLDPAKLVPVLTAALQEAIKRIEVLESK